MNLFQNLSSIPFAVSVIALAFIFAESVINSILESKMKKVLGRLKQEPQFKQTWNKLQDSSEEVAEALLRELTQSIQRELGSCSANETKMARKIVREERNRLIHQAARNRLERDLVHAQ